MVPIIFNSLKADLTETRLEAVQEIYSGIRPGNIVVSGKEDEILSEYLFSIKRFDLGEVGRFRINQRLRLDVQLDVRVITAEDFISTAAYLIGLRHGDGFTDDIDHLGVRRARSVGELLANQIRVGFARMGRTVRERMRTRDVETMTPSDLVNARIICLFRFQFIQFFYQVLLRLLLVFHSIPRIDSTAL